MKRSERPLPSRVFTSNLGPAARGVERRGVDWEAERSVDAGEGVVVERVDEEVIDSVGDFA